MVGPVLSILFPPSHTNRTRRTRLAARRADPTNRPRSAVGSEGVVERLTGRPGDLGGRREDLQGVLKWRPL